MKLIINNIENQDELDRFAEIFAALIKSGGLTGVKGGQTIIHFDDQASFRGIQLSYWPWRKRKD